MRYAGTWGMSAPRAIGEPMESIKYDIYLGFSDRDTLTQNVIPEQVINRLAEVFSEWQIGFSLVKQFGGYVFEDGTYICENSIIVTLIADPNVEDITPSIYRLKEQLNQESVLVVKKSLERDYYSLSEEII